MLLRKHAKPTLTALELHHGDSVEFRLLDGSLRTITLKSTGAGILNTTLNERGVPEPGAKTVYYFSADIHVDDWLVHIEREVGRQRSLYEPVVVEGVCIWLDAVDAIFDFMIETHRPCRPQANCSEVGPPRRHARLALQDATISICPEKLHPWCPLPAGGLKIENCYRGEDCWLGAYDGACTHAGLDINHPKGTGLFVPFDLDDQFYFNSVAAGANNNRWRGIRQWRDGSTWIIQTAHMVRLTVPEHQPLKCGQQFAEGAGVWVGEVEHSHFAFAVLDEGELIRLDPWILFWQMYRDNCP